MGIGKFRVAIEVRRNWDWICPKAISVNVIIVVNNTCEQYMRADTWAVYMNSDRMPKEIEKETFKDEKNTLRLTCLNTNT